jgi:hypothetical protein
MSVAGYLGKKAGELRLEAGDVPAGVVGGAVLEGKLSVEEAQAVAVRRGRRARPVGAYQRVAEYDPVLRSHCRLDKEG